MECDRFMTLTGHVVSLLISQSDTFLSLRSGNNECSFSQYSRLNMMTALLFLCLACLFLGEMGKLHFYALNLLRLYGRIESLRHSSHIDYTNVHNLT